MPELNLAVARLHGTNEPSKELARGTLKYICTGSTNGSLRCQALRELILDAAHYRQTNQALVLAKQLTLESNSVFADKLVRLDLLREVKSAEYRPTLAALEHYSANLIGPAYEMGMYLMAKTTPAETLAWLQSLPPSTQTNQPVTTLEAECLDMTSSWRGLQSFVAQQNWLELEFMRHAFVVRALRGQNQITAATLEWQSALKAANGDKAGLMMLLRVTAQWKWQDEVEEVLWSIVNLYPHEQSAVQALSEALVIGGRTRSLMTLCAQQLKVNPTDSNLKNNLAMTALLLDAKELRPHDLARELYQQAPTNASFAGTYAYSLHVQGKDADALKVMQLLKPKELEEPSLAGYYGIILKATGNKASAKHYLDLSATAKCLPEELKLFQQARQGL